MKRFKVARIARLLLPGMILLQSSGCDPFAVAVFLQTVFLGITAAGSLAILDNL